MKIAPTILTIVLTSFAVVSCAPNPTGGGDTPNPADAANAKFPVGHPHPEGKKNLVVSPYRPYNVIDVKGYRSGDLVGDPSTARTDPKTGKLIPSTAKSFRIP